MVRAGVPCAPVLNIKQVSEHRMIREREAIVQVPWEGREVAMVNVLPRFSESPGAIRWAAPKPGEHTTEILRELGMDDARIQQLAADGVIASPARGTSE